MRKTKPVIVALLLFVFTGTSSLETRFDFKIRTITAGVILRDISDVGSITSAIQFLEKSKQVFTDRGYQVQTLRISTQNLHELIGGKPTHQTIEALKKIDENRALLPRPSQHSAENRESGLFTEDKAIRPL